MLGNTIPENIDKLINLIVKDKDFDFLLSKFDSILDKTLFDVLMKSTLNYFSSEIIIMLDVHGEGNEKLLYSDYFKFEIMPDTTEYTIGELKIIISNFIIVDIFILHDKKIEYRNTDKTLGELFAISPVKSARIFTN